MTRSIFTPDTKRKLERMQGLQSIQANHRDASGGPWKMPPTPIADPSRVRHQPASNHNPWVFNNTLSSNKPRPGNPNVSQTLLFKFGNESSPVDDRAPKRQRLDSSISAGPAYEMNGASSSRARRVARPSSASEPEIQVVDPPNPVSNDAEIMILRGSSEDVGERVSRTTRTRTSSPDPICFLRSSKASRKPLQKPSPEFHAFDTHPKTNLPVASKGKGRAPSPVVVEGSEEDEIEDFSRPPSRDRPSDTKTSQVIPKNIVKNRRTAYERVSEPAAVRQPVQRGVPSIHLAKPNKANLVSGMKGKDEHPSRAQGGTGYLDPVGTSSSNFTNSAREKEGVFSLPLDAWCFGHHHIKDLEDGPLTLCYEHNSKSMRVISGKHRREVKFKLDRDVDSVKIVKDDTESLKSNVVIQFTTTPGNEWRKYQSKLKGFEAAGERQKGDLTFLFSTAKERGFNLTQYHRLVTLIRKEFASTAVEILRPAGGASCWEVACQLADMYERMSNVGNDDPSETIEGERLSLTRGTTPSSTSVKSQISRPDFNPSNDDMGPPIPPRRSTRQSVSQRVEGSSPRPTEPDELVLMYPPTGTGALSVMRSDLKRLGPEEYLNDTLIEFGLKLWLNDLREKDPALADQIHVFSSFFYKKLNNRKNPEEGYRSVRKWTSKVPLFSKKYVIVPINENIHWYLAIIYEPGHTLEPPLPPSQPLNARMTRKRKQEHPEGDVETPLHAEPVDVSSEQPNSSREVPQADPSSMNATCASTPSITEDAEMDDASIAAFDKSCTISASKPVSATSSIGQTLDCSSLPDLLHPASDDMEIDVDNSMTEVHPVPKKAEIQASSMSKSSVVPVNYFYASAPKNAQDRLADAPVIITDEDNNEDQQQEAEVDDMLAMPQSSTPNSPPQTYIFTLDSLGTRHPQAIKVLKQYLAFEAKDKHNFDEVREAVGKQVQVPVQPNSWDCGIYLLHFVKVFMSSPAQFLEQILSTRGTVPSSERKKRWQDQEIPLIRDNLISRITELSEKWKTVREEEAKKREMEDLSSEGEVDIVDDVPRGKVVRQKRHATRPSGDGELDIVEEVPSGKAAPIAREKRPATRLRG